MNDTITLPPHTELVVLDMAGTTVADHGAVELAFETAASRTNVAERLPWAEALNYVRETMGQSKIEVFTHLADGDVEAAERATAEFEVAYAASIADGGVTAIPGAADTIRELRAAGLTVALTTGFSPATRDAIIAALGWEGLADAAYSPRDAGRGRPAPDLVLTAALRARVSSVSCIAVFGDTSSDVASGLNAGAGVVGGVLTGAHDRAALEAAGAQVVLDDVTQIHPAPGR